MSAPPNQSNRPQAGHGAASAPPLESQLIAAQDVESDGEEDADSTLGSDAESSTASVSSSILDYRRLQGRTYHSERFTSNYFLPNDEQQLNSVDLSHHYLMILLDDRLYLPPLQNEKMQRVLDIGTGTGIWAIEYADRHPNIEIIGTDLSPCQPQWVPPNVRFEIDDAALEWTWDANHFDFVHIRYLFGAIKDWNALLKEAYRCCVPGGWVQSGECDVDFRSDDETTDLEPVLESYGQLFREGGKILGYPFFVRELQQEAFETAGFTDIQTVDYKIPVGGWAKDPKLAEVGNFVRSTLENDLEGYTIMICQDLLKWSKDEHRVWLAKLRKAIRNPKVHSYMIVRYVYGRKPM